MSTSAMPSAWQHDVLNRKPYADFLTGYIETRVRGGATSLTVALDAGWGAGKTFFINGWKADIESNNGAAMLFDAWKNDHTSDAIVGFMAELQSEILRLSKLAPAPAAVTRLTHKAAQVRKTVRKAILPAIGVVGAAALKKATGISIDAVADAVSGAEISIDVEDVTKSAGKDIEKALDAFFKRTLDEHRSRVKATNLFKEHLREFVQMLVREGVMRGPLYIFIDELDRCRPDYAIRLLEAVKHLFAVPSVVFVLATNIDQFSRSVQAVYGPSFDGNSYLRRFFDFHCSLPRPTSERFTALLNARNPRLLARVEINGSTGLPKNQVTRLPYPPEVVMTAIADAFSLTLRDQEQVHLLADAAASGIPDGKPIYLSWLYFLCALRHRSRETFDRLQGAVNVNEAARQLNIELNQISMTHRTLVQGNYVQRPVLFSELITKYHSLAKTPWREINQQRLNSDDFVDQLGADLSPSKRNPSRSELQDYYGLVESAGMLGQYESAEGRS